MLEAQALQAGVHRSSQRFRPVVDGDAAVRRAADAVFRGEKDLAAP
jgi:hypothetical protein